MPGTQNRSDKTGLSEIRPRPDAPYQDPSAFLLNFPQDQDLNMKKNWAARIADGGWSTRKEIVRKRIKPYKTQGIRVPKWFEVECFIL